MILPITFWLLPLRSTNFPVQNPFQSMKSHGQDGVIFKLKNDFTSMIFPLFMVEIIRRLLFCKNYSSDNIVFAGGTILTIYWFKQWSFSFFSGGKSDGLS